MSNPASAGGYWDELRAAVRCQGYALMPSALPKALVTDLSAALDRCREDEEALFGRTMLEEIGQDGYVSDLFRLGSPLAALLDCDLLHDLLRAVFEEPARLCVGQGIILDPGKGRGVWPRCWHADMYAIRRAMPDPGYCFGLNFLVLVDDMSEANGPTCLLPGSQALAELASDAPEDIAAREVRTTAPAGSVLLIDGGTWHSAGMNRSDRRRRVLKLLFTRPWIRPQIDYAPTLSAAMLDGLSSRARALIGA